MHNKLKKQKNVHNYSCKILLYKDNGNAIYYLKVQQTFSTEKKNIKNDTLMLCLHHFINIHKIFQITLKL